MTPKLFNKLPNPERYIVLESLGVNLGLTRPARRSVASLYAIEGFYCEVHYTPATNKLGRAVAFDDLRKLDAFLQGVDISPVVS